MVYLFNKFFPIKNINQYMISISKNVETINFVFWNLTDTSLPYFERILSLNNFIILCNTSYFNAPFKFSLQ